MKKIIIIIICSLMLIFLLTCLSLGLFSPYNYFTAKRDISKNIIRKICIDEHPTRLSIDQKVGKKYGIDVKCLYTRWSFEPLNIRGINMYNDIMNNEFIRKKGTVVYRNYIRELDSLNMKYIVK